MRSSRADPANFPTDPANMPTDPANVPTHAAMASADTATPP